MKETNGGVDVSFSAVQRKQIFAKHNAACADCGKTWQDGYMLDCHHEVPLGEGGSNSISNGKLLCRLCHLKAHTKLYNEAKYERQKKVNAYAVRKIRETIKEKGLKRYGH